MFLTSRRFLMIAIISSFALVVGACDSSGGASSTTTAGDGPGTTGASTATTVAPISTIPPDSIPGTNSDSISPEVAAQMRTDIGVIMLQVEETRGLPFLEIPTVTILDEAAFTARVSSDLDEELDPDEVAGQEAMFNLLGMLDPDVDLYELLVSLYTEQVAGFYDLDTKEMVVPVSVDGITALQELTISHELVHALTDQHFDIGDTYTDLVDNGTQDDASAMLGLVEGDATYQQFLFLESWGPLKATQAAFEALTIDTTVLDSVPTWMQQDLAFPYEQGLIFTTYLMDESGLKGVDAAYQDPPLSTEQILDPNKYLRGETPAALAPLTVTLDGWEVFEEATLGEWGIRMLLTDTLRPGERNQAAAGWGNDTYRFFLNGADSVFVWSYLGESVPDAEDLSNALIAHARDTMGATGAEESGGGIEFGGGSPYVFVDRIDDAIFFIASTDPVAGADIREQLGL
ncbi:MAG: hypothetical protein ACR2N7_07905 [Acidimicrobiia bacterium]